jgi:hypothetical protein
MILLTLLLPGGMIDRMTAALLGTDLLANEANLEQPPDAHC